MLKYKTLAIPSVPFKGVKKNEYYGELSMDTASEAVAPVGLVVEEQAKSGWILHSVKFLPQTIIRKKTIFELLFGWIPLLGWWLFPNLDDTRNGKDVMIYTMVFVKES